MDFIIPQFWTPTLRHKLGLRLSPTNWFLCSIDWRCAHPSGAGVGWVSEWAYANNKMRSNSWYCRNSDEIFIWNLSSSKMTYIFVEIVIILRSTEVDVVAEWEIRGLLFFTTEVVTSKYLYSLRKNSVCWYIQISCASAAACAFTCCRCSHLYFFEQPCSVSSDRLFLLANVVQLHCFVHFLDDHCASRLVLHSGHTRSTWSIEQNCVSSMHRLSIVRLPVGSQWTLISMRCHMGWPCTQWSVTASSDGIMKPVQCTFNDSTWIWAHVAISLMVTCLLTVGRCSSFRVNSTALGKMARQLSAAAASFWCSRRPICGHSASWTSIVSGGCQRWWGWFGAWLKCPKFCMQLLIKHQLVHIAAHVFAPADFRMMVAMEKASPDQCRSTACAPHGQCSHQSCCRCALPVQFHVGSRLMV